jgi:hypothetical protein
VCYFEGRIWQIPCIFSLLAGNSRGEGLAPDCVLRHIFNSLGRMKPA